MSVFNLLRQNNYFIIVIKSSKCYVLIWLTSSHARNYVLIVVLNIVIWHWVHPMFKFRYFKK